MSDLFAEHKNELPEEWHETFDALTGQGKSPTGIKATIEYVTSDKTQQEVSNEFHVSEVTIRNLQTAVIALGPVDRRTESRHHSHHKTSMDYCTHIADILGWEEGVEYAVSGPTYRNSKQPALRKEGWKRLYQHIAEGSE